MFDLYVLERTVRQIHLAQLRAYMISDRLRNAPNKSNIRLGSIKGFNL